MKAKRRPKVAKDDFLVTVSHEKLWALIDAAQVAGEHTACEHCSGSCCDNLPDSLVNVANAADDMTSWLKTNARRIPTSAIRLARGSKP